MEPDSVDPLEHVKMTGKVLRCHPTGDQYIDFKHVPLAGAVGTGVWVKTFEDWDESITVEESGVRYVLDLSNPEFEFIEESESHFAEMRENPPKPGRGAYDR